jgi:glycine cleavage system aminomethyltransferase T
MAIAGPKARLVVQALVEDDISDAAFPFLAAGIVTLKGGDQGATVPDLVFRRTGL